MHCGEGVAQSKTTHSRDGGSRTPYRPVHWLLNEPREREKRRPRHNPATREAEREGTKYRDQTNHRRQMNPAYIWQYRKHRRDVFGLAGHVAVPGPSTEPPLAKRALTDQQQRGQRLEERFSRKYSC